MKDFTLHGNVCFTNVGSGPEPPIIREHAIYTTAHKHRQQPFKEMAIELVVSVHADYELGTRRPDPGISRRCKAAIAFVSQWPDTSVIHPTNHLPHYLTIRGTVVNDNGFPLLKAL